MYAWLTFGFGRTDAEVLSAQGFTLTAAEMASLNGVTFV